MIARRRGTSRRVPEPSVVGARVAKLAGAANQSSASRRPPRGGGPSTSATPRRRRTHCRTGDVLGQHEQEHHDLALFAQACSARQDAAHRLAIRAIAPVW